MKKRVLYSCSFILLLTLIASVPMVQQSSKLSTMEFSKVVRKISDNGWVYFNTGFRPDAKKFFTTYMKDFGLSTDDEMKLVKEETDSIFTFYRFKHYYKGILVEGSSMSLQFKNNNIELAFGTLAKNLKIDVNPTVSEGFALEVAKKSSKAELFAWESNKMESSLRKELRDSSATYKPKGEIVITRADNGEFKLTYKFDIVSVKPKYNSELYYVSANTGKFVKSIPQFYDATSTGKVYYYSEDKQFTTNFVHAFPRGHWCLQDQTRGIISAKLNYFPEYWDDSPFLDDWDNYWDWESERPAVSTLWAVEKSYDYFHSRGRHGTNDNNREMKLTTMFPDFNAGWGTSTNQTWDDIVIGYVNDTSLSALDIVGHEFTHGVTFYSANLAYVADESGALNESFSDIFGEIIEYYVDGSNDWKLGSDFFTTRSLDNPHESHMREGLEHGHQPAVYHENGYWTDTTNVGFYVHKNSGVQNKWFYLLVEGDSQLGVTGIGMQAASNIAFTALTSYLLNTPNATFAQAREASENSAIYHYGLCSNQYQQVQNAWAAVGVGDPATCILLEVSSIYVSPYPACGEYCNFSVNASGGNGTISYEWYVNDALISTYSSMSYYFPEYYSGSYSITLHVTDGNQNVYRYEYYYISCGDNLMESENGITMSVYPNPATDQATIRILDNKKAIDELVNSDYNISIVDNSGRVLYKTKTKSNEININLGGYQKGTYSLIVTRGKYKGSSLIIKK
jgi:bacillolysin